MQDLKQVNENAYTYVLGLDKTKWAAPFIPGTRYGHTTSNIVESVNSTFVDERKQSCIELLDGIWNKTLNLRYERKEQSFQYLPNEHLTSYGNTLLHLSFQNAQHRTVQLSDEFNGIVTSFTGKRYVVDFQKLICTCGRYQEVGIPMWSRNCMYSQAATPSPWLYSRVFYCSSIPRNLCHKLSSNRYNWSQKSPHCRPPILGAPKGRPPTRRKRAGDRMTRGLTGPRRPPVIDVDIEVEPEILRTVLPAPIKQKCGKCKEEGHNARKCRKPLALDLIVLEDDWSHGGWIVLTHDIDGHFSLFVFSFQSIFYFLINFYPCFSS